MGVCKRCVVALVAVLGLWGGAAAEPVRPAGVSKVRPDPGLGATPPTDYILNACTEKPSTGNPRSAMRAVDPAYMLKNYIEGRDIRVVELSDIKNVTMLQDATLGKVTSVVDNTGRSWYRYDAPANYEGNDKAIFMGEYQGKLYKIVVEMHLFEVVDESASSCPPAKLIKVTQPSSGFNTYDMNTINVTFSDLAVGARG